MSALAQIATGRAQSLFAPDLEAEDAALRAALAGTRILAVGAAGSIGSHTVFTLCRYGPRAIHVVDQNENGLAEFVRQFRASYLSGAVSDLRTMPLDYGAASMELLLEQEGPYDLVLNFAAIKHVRSEKDEYSVLQMLDTNIVKQARLMRWIGRHSPGARYFSVSTDKAANPSSFMGATKRIMEHLMFDDEMAEALGGAVTSARFANVAFSNGSLLQGFQHRLARREPIACPLDISRYFVSLEEAGEICTLAALLVENGYIAVPRLDPKSNLVPLRGIAERFIAHHGFTPAPYNDEAEAKARAETDIASGRWPLLLTRGDTAGEKPYEEFVAEGETAQPTRLRAIEAIAHLPPRRPVGPLATRLEAIILGAERADKEALKALIGTVEPAFLATHRESTLNLDQRL